MNTKIKTGDCRLLMAETYANFFHAVVTDPPYGPEFSTIEFDKSRDDLSHRHAQFSRSGAGLPRYGTWMPTSSPESAAVTLKQRRLLQDWHGGWLKEAYRVLRPGGWLAAFSASPVYHRLATAAEDVGFEVRGMVVWLCGQGWPKSAASLRPAIEPILLARKPFSEYGIAANKEKWGTGDLNHEYAKEHTGRTASDAILSEEVAQQLGQKAAYFYAGKVTKSERVDHPTQKPVDVFVYLLSLFSSTKEHVVLDPFCGSGTSGVAASQLGVQWLGMEIDPKHVTTATRRLSSVSTG